MATREAVPLGDGITHSELGYDSVPDIEERTVITPPPWEHTRLLIRCPMDADCCRQDQRKSRREITNLIQSKQKPVFETR